MKNATKRKSQSEVVSRARLRGPLNDLFDETELSDGNVGSTSMDSRHKEEPIKRGRPPKRRDSQVPELSGISQRSSKMHSHKRMTPVKQNTSESDESESDNSEAHGTETESCVFKLFSRRVDMSKFSKNTPLYPVCRAWFANNPEDLNAINYRTRKQQIPHRRAYEGVELWNKVRRNEMKEVYELPRPCETSFSHIPPLLKPAFPQDKDSIDAILTESYKNKVAVEKLLQEHLVRWNQVRTHWTTHTIKYRQERFKYSYLILQHLQKRNRDQIMLQQM